MDQELLLCLWQPNQSKMLTDGHSMQQPRPPRTVRLFPACKNNKQLPEQQQPSFPRLSPWRLLLSLSLRLDHAAGGWVPAGLGHFVVSPYGSFQLPHLQSRPSQVQLTLASLSKAVGRGWTDKQAGSCYGPISPIVVGYKARKTNSSNPVCCAPLYSKYRTLCQGWENPSHQGGRKYQHLGTRSLRGANPSLD